MIVFRYLAKEVYTTVIAVMGILVVIFLSQQVIRFLGIAASGKISMSVLMHVIALETPILLGLLLPIGMFLGILLVYGRLYMDNEMTVLSSCGFSQSQLIKYTIVIAGIVAVIAGALTLWFNPIIAAQKETLMNTSGQATALQTMLPGRFQESPDGKYVFYVQKLSSETGKAQNLFMAQLSPSQQATKASNGQDQNQWMVLSAQTGYHTQKGNDQANYLVADKGYRYQGVTGQNDFMIVHFGEYGVRLDTETQTVDKGNESAIASLDLLSRGTLDDLSELQWRISIPLVTLILALLAVPLSKVNPRYGKYAKLLPAVLLCLLYVNLLFVARSWVEDGRVPPWIGLWWVHLIFLAIACFILFKPILMRRRS